MGGRSNCACKEFGVSLVGHSRKQKLVIGRHFVNDEFLVNDRTYRYRQYEQRSSRSCGPPL